MDKLTGMQEELNQLWKGNGRREVKIEVLKWLNANKERLPQWVIDGLLPIVGEPE